jgi:hypothetical protein
LIRLIKLRVFSTLVERLYSRADHYDGLFVGPALFHENVFDGFVHAQELFYTYFVDADPLHSGEIDLVLFKGRNKVFQVEFFE